MINKLLIIKTGENHKTRENLYQMKQIICLVKLLLSCTWQLSEVIVSNCVSGKQGIAEMNINAQGTYSKYLSAKYLVMFCILWLFKAHIIIPTRRNL